MVVGRLKRLSFWNGPFLGDMLVFAGVGFFHGGGCRARWAAFFCHLRHPEKRKHSGETNVWDILVKILRLPKGIRNSSESKLLVEEGSKGWSFVQLISDLGDLRPLRQVPTVFWKNQKSEINSAVEVEPLVVKPCYLQGFSSIPGGCLVGISEPSRVYLRWHPSTVFTLFTVPLLWSDIKVVLRCFCTFWDKHYIPYIHMGVSKNGGTPKWTVYNGKPY